METVDQFMPTTSGLAAISSLVIHSVRDTKYKLNGSLFVNQYCKRI